MRLSSNTIYATSTAKLLDLQANQSRLQNQISTGKRINTPSDDPIAAGKALALTQSQSVNKQYQSNRIAADTQLGLNETVLSNMTDLVLNTQSLIVGAGNGALSDADRNAIATELSQNLDQLVGLANSKDGAGNYIFSGYQTNTEPYVKNLTDTGYIYQGDTNKTAIQVSSSRKMEVTSGGSAIFQDGGNDLFQNIKDVIAVLRTPVTTPALNTALNAGLATSNAGLKQSLDSILTARSDFGSKMREIDSLNSAGAAADIVFDKNISDLQDLDYTKAISDLSKQQTILEAAQKSFVKTTSLSLFNII